MSQDLGALPIGEDELRELLDEQMDLIEADGWRIRTLADVDWALKRVADLRQERAENEAILERTMAKLAARTEALNARVDRGVSFLEAHLRAWAEAHRAELTKGKKKSRALLHGSIGWRTKPARLVVVDKDALLAWCRLQPVETGVVRFKEEPALDELQRRFKQQGEVPPGTDAEPEREDFSIKPITLEGSNGNGQQQDD